MARRQRLGVHEFGQGRVRVGSVVSCPLRVAQNTIPWKLRKFGTTVLLRRGWPGLARCGCGWPGLSWPLCHCHTVSGPGLTEVVPGCLGLPTKCWPGLTQVVRGVLVKRQPRWQGGAVNPRTNPKNGLHCASTDTRARLSGTPGRIIQWTIGQQAVQWMGGAGGSRNKCSISCGGLINLPDGIGGPAQNDPPRHTATRPVLFRVVRGCPAAKTDCTAPRHTSVSRRC
jgi:hypothetical protein